MTEEGRTLAEYGITDAYTKDEVDRLIPVFPTVVSAFINDVGYLDKHQDISGKQDRLTNAQLAAANSGITTDKVALYDGYGVIASQKQDKLNDSQMIAANSGITANKVYAYNSYESSIQNKANKATTLSGYGITDTYTKEDIEGMFDTLKGIIDEALEETLEEE